MSLRFVEPKPRKVLFSKKFPTCVPAEVTQAFNSFCNIAEQGRDLNPFQSKGLVKFNDISSNKKQTRTDLLWANWGILHFHLTHEEKIKGEYFSPRSKWLVFAIIVKDTVGIIDIRNHNEEDLFSDVSLIHTVAERWPTFISKFELIETDATEHVIRDRRIKAG